MKTKRITVASFVSAVVLTGALAAVAQQANQSSQRNQSGQTDQTNQNSSSADSQSGAGGNQGLGKLDDKTRGATIRASQLMGQDIKNSNGDNVGEIKDLVIDGSGKVRYAAVTYGGFIGIGSKMFAVPFEAFQVRQNPNDRNDRDDNVLTLNVTKEQLEGAQGFDNDRWPDFADNKFTQELDRRYKVDRSQTNSSSQAERSQNRNESRQ
jgi:sporulation protein YlmC with PRC-barrel domain